MLRPIDMQVAFQAMPDVARSTSVEQAGLLYRNVAELGQARAENMVRQGRVETNQAAQATVFRPVNREEQEDKRHRGSGRDGGFREREKRLDSTERQLYGVSMRHIFSRARYEEASWRNLDLSA